MGWDAIDSARCALLQVTDISNLMIERQEAGQELDYSRVAIGLRDASVELKDCLAAVKQNQSDLYEELRVLSKAYEQRGTVSKHLDAYYLDGDNGQPSGDPHCLMCWEKQHFLIHLIRRPENLTICPNCDTRFMADATPFRLNPNT